MDRPTARSNRPGFTLIELLVIIVIIALLLALLLPAINGAVRSARNAAVSAEINQLAQALADFKSKYGDYPPSRMLLCEDGWFHFPLPSPATSASDVDISAAALVQRSVAYMRKFWPRVAVSTSGPIFTGPPYPNGWYDFNGNGAVVTAPENPYILQGHECLVFFLGGIPTTGGVSGFARNPQNPFQSDTVATNRQPPLFEFKADRLALTNPTLTSGQAGFSGIPGYLDSLASGTDRRFYAYFSAYGSNGYDPNDVNFDDSTNTNPPAIPESDANAVSPITLGFHVSFPVQANTANSSFADPSHTTVSAPPNPYTSTLSVPATGSTSYQNPNSFQVISAGADGEYGIGGQYSPTSSTPLPNQAGTNSTDTGLRAREKDNLTNFKIGTLD
jgi:prepilin-type N-terminal cleavage/methylation domain-containing protein